MNLMPRFKDIRSKINYAIENEQCHGMFLPRFCISHILTKTNLCKLFTIDTDCFKVVFTPSIMASRLWANPKYYHKSLEIYRNFCRPGDCIVDIGANIGIVTLTCASIVGSNGIVISIEPHPVTHKYLKQNVRLNNLSNVKLYQLAVGNERGKVSFSNYIDDSINKISYNGMFQVEIMPLDDIISVDRSIDLLKIDVEGYERCVFEGASKTLENVKNIYFEVLSKDDFYSTIFPILEKKGFSIYIPKKDKLIPLNLDNQSQQDRQGEIPDLIASRDIKEFLKKNGVP